MLRKEKFSAYGLTRKNLLAAVLLSALCCVPGFLYNLFVGNVHAWLPFSDVHTTAEALARGFPENVLAMLIVRKVTRNAWGCVLIFALYWNAL